VEQAVEKIDVAVQHRPRVLDLSADRLAPAPGQNRAGEACAGGAQQPPA
jgi:hypothetical protein